jgi:putative ABC transport system ATP-binding protein
MSVLELRGISKVYGKGAAEVQALRDVNLRVGAGSMVAVMGPARVVGGPRPAPTSRAAS